MLRHARRGSGALRASGDELARSLVTDIADLTLVDAHTALTALESLAGPNGTDAGRVLRYLFARHRQRGTSEVLERWIEHRARGMGSPRPLNAGSAR